ncbi:uncharacterized protein LOC126803645 [Argentina anserina]|uniref:uncharacterized protein LOC126803645 n=1 Tax=Argentina anserina TaxID=57926 RepID=UPI0021768612|nr:uncharacterized protein LOC126803645 [Potentilla anserina]
MAGDDEQKVIEHTKNSTSSRTTDPWENPNHQLFMHHSDQLGTALVSPPLMEDNYIDWAESMIMALTIKNKNGFVNGTLKRSLTNLDEQRQWDRCNILVKTWLLGSMSKEIKRSLAHCKYASDIWDELQERFSHTNTFQLFNIENDVHECEQGTCTVTAFFTKLKGLWDERDAICGLPPCTCKAATDIKTYMETQKTMKFLMGLNEEYATIRSNIISMDPLPSLNKVYAAAVRHERQAEISGGKTVAPPEASAFSVKKFNRGGNHSESEIKRKNAIRGGQIHAKANHAISFGDDEEDIDDNLPLSQSDCHKFFKLVNKIKSAAANHGDYSKMLEALNDIKPTTANLVGNIPNYEELSGKAFSVLREGIEPSWIIDSGASDHIACTSSLLTSLRPVHNRVVKLPDGSMKHVTHIGTVVFSPQFVLHNVLYVPKFYLNLIYVSKLSFDSFYVTIFLRQVCVIQDL